MTSERYYPALSQALFGLSVSVVLFTLLNVLIGGPWPGHFGEKYYGLPFLKNLFGLGNSQPVFGPDGVWSSQEILLLVLAIISFAGGKWAGRFRPNFVVPTGGDAIDSGDEFSATVVSASAVSTTGPTSDNYLKGGNSPFINPTTSSIVDSIITEAETVNQAAISSASNLLAAVTPELPVKEVAKSNAYNEIPGIDNLILDDAPEVKMPFAPSNNISVALPKDGEESNSLPPQVVANAEAIQAKNVPLPLSTPSVQSQTEPQPQPQNDELHSDEMPDISNLFDSASVDNEPSPSSQPPVEPSAEIIGSDKLESKPSVVVSATIGMPDLSELLEEVVQPNDIPQPAEIAPPSSRSNELSDMPDLSSLF
ncbi:MAG TPA: hypothetical protein EYQ53_04980 [Candidatus Poseidoniales archaeon]|jgi:hypothetical protein|nr:MAG: hypothetical protein CXT69_01905 [Euryarchaeota archaeon]HIG03716.1 hypothetical protein [Candidatus Poseidoniales archaeon]HIK78160.1 hypothetical protein [Candidatus Poseidoniales archaeon]